MFDLINSCFFQLPFRLQARCVDCNHNASIAMDHRSKAIEVAQQLRTMVMPKETIERTSAMQSIEQMCAAIQNTNFKYH